MLFYLIIFSLSTLFIHLGSKSKTRQQLIMYSIGVLIPVIAATYRGISVGKDTAVYIELYYAYVSASSIDQLFMMMNTELLFILTSYIGTFLGGYKFVFFCYSFLTITFLLITLNKYKRYLCISLGYIMFLFLLYNTSLNIMRQMLAVSFILFSTSFLLENKKTLFKLLLIISLTIHLTAFAAGIIIYIIYKAISASKNIKPLIYKLYALSLIIAFFMCNIIISYLANIGYGNSYAYVKGMDPSVISSTDVLYSLILIYIAYKAMIKKEISVISPDFFFLSSLTCLTLFCTGYYNMWFSRMAYYMLIFACVYLPMIVNSPKLRRYKKIYSIGIIFASFSYWLYLIVISGSNKTIPYLIN